MFNAINSLFRSLGKYYRICVHCIKIQYLKLNGAEIGEKTWILENLIKQAAIMPRKLKIGNRCVICLGAVLICGDAYGLLLKRNHDKKRENDGITIKDNCFIGEGAIVMNGVSIGPNSIIGAGTVVVDDVKPNTCVAGNPGRYICDISSYAKISKNSLIEGYSELKQMNMSKSEFLIGYFWERQVKG